jgi:hypothetical protein
VAFLCGVAAAGAAPACGGSFSNAGDSQTAGAGGASDKGGSNGKGGNTGKGGSAATAGNAGASSGVQCGTKTCNGVVSKEFQDFEIPGCCADAASERCGLDSSVLAMFGPTFGEACQPLAQPGSDDASCPKSAAAPVQGTGFSIQFPGCCQANGSCGYRLDSVAGGLIQLGLGCVDSSPFLDGGTPATCGGGGAAGEGGMGGAGPVSFGEGGISGEAAGGASSG